MQDIPIKDPLADAVINGSMQDIILVYWFGDGSQNRYEIAQEYSFSDIIEGPQDILVARMTDLMVWLTGTFEKYPKAAINQKSVTAALVWSSEALEYVEQVETKPRLAAGPKRRKD